MERRRTIGRKLMNDKEYKIIMEVHSPIGKFTSMVLEMTKLQAEKWIDVFENGAEKLYFPDKNEDMLYFGKELLANSIIKLKNLGEVK